MKFHLLIFSLAIITEYGCSTDRTTDSAHNITDVHINDAAMNLPMPFIPDSLSTDEQRASYFVTHFWDQMDFHNRSLSLDTAFFEQNFSNFIATIPIVSHETAHEAINKLIAEAGVDKAALDLLIHTADLYLDHPDSPMRNEETYIHFLKGFLEISTIPEYVKSRYEYRLTQAMKNRPGTTAPNFRVILRNGRTSDLHSLLAVSESIVMFYDSDCEHCKEISQRLAGMQFKGDVNIIAIDVAGNQQIWDKMNDSLPTGWTVGYDLDNIDERELYYLPALPTFYILGHDGVIIAKDISL